MDSLLFCGNYSVKIELESSVILSYTGTVRRGGAMDIFEHLEVVFLKDEAKL